MTTENKTLSNRLLDNVLDGILILDFEGNVLYINPALAEMFDMEPDIDVSGMNAFEFVHPEYHEAVITDLANVSQHRGGYLNWYKAVSAAGREFWIEGLGRDLLYNGKMANLVTVRDISERKKTEDELRAHQEHLELINKILRHDLINNLTVIKSALSLYGRTHEAELLDEASGYVEKSVLLIRRMRELEILISRHRNLKLCDARNIIEEIAANYSAIDFTITGTYRIMADESLGPVIDNLIRNAVHHGKCRHITITIEHTERFCDIKIADDGIGIPDGIRGLIFNEGYAYSDTGQSGLGLHIVKRIMESYSGLVFVESNEPRGTVFTLRFQTVE